MRILRAIPIVLAALFFLAPGARAACSGSGVTWSCTAGSTQAQVQAAVNSASNNATITLANGTYTWASAVAMSATNGVTIICASAGGCTLNGGGQQFVISTLCGCTNPNLYRISGFVFSTSGNQSQVIFSSGGGSVGTSIYQQVRLDHNTLSSSNLTNGFMATFGDQGSIGIFYGVLDHNTVNAAGSFGLFIVYGAQPTTYPAASLGTAFNLFAEDNTLVNTTSTNSGSGCTDGWTGGIVWRHNTSTNCLLTLHGVTHNGGPWNWEVYDNQVTQNSNSSFPGGYRSIHSQGSGTFTAWGNTFTAVAPHDSEIISLLYYRDYGPYAGCPVLGSIECNIHFADGTQSMDGNRSPTATYRGYPAWHQPGRDYFAQYSPDFFINNKWTNDSSLVPGVVPDGGYGSPDYQPNHMQNDREYFNGVSASAQSNPTTPFNGTTGAGYGTLANRPTTCTTSSETALNQGAGGVMYLATDQGSQGTIYTCSATNTWTVYEIPYQYPHPLVTGGTPAVNLSPASISWTSGQLGAVTIGQTSTPVTITLTNTGSATLNISGFSFSTPTSIFATSGTGACTSLAPLATCNFTVTFSPTNPNHYTNTILVATDASSSPDTVDLEGDGVPSAGTGGGIFGGATVFGGGTVHN